MQKVIFLLDEEIRMLVREINKNISVSGSECAARKIICLRKIKSQCEGYLAQQVFDEK